MIYIGMRERQRQSYGPTDRMEAAVISPLSFSLSLSLKTVVLVLLLFLLGMELPLKPDLGIEIESYRISQSHPLLSSLSSSRIGGKVEREKKESAVEIGRN